ncbi:MAG: sensor histidine kinase [Negativicutes bacterium]
MDAARSLKFKFLYFSAIVSFISITLLVSVFFFIANKIQVDDAEKLLNTALKTAWSEFYYQPEQLKSYLMGISNDDDLQNAVRKSNSIFLEKQIKKWQNLFPAADFWAITDENGFTISHSRAIRYLNLCHPNIVNKLNEMKKPIITTELIPASILEKENSTLANKARIYYKNPSQENSSFNDALVNVVFYPLLDEDRKIIGIIFGGFLLNNDTLIAQEYTKKVPNTYLSLGVKGVRVISNIDTQELSHPSGSMQIQQVVEVTSKGNSFRGLERTDNQPSGLVAIDPIKNSEDEVVANLGVGAPLNMLTPFKKQSVYLLLLIGVIALGVAMLLSLKLSLGILAPIYKLKQLSFDITNQTVETKDIMWSEKKAPKEISELAFTIISMAKTLKQKESEVKVYAQDLAEEKSNLEIKVAERTSELVQTINELKNTNQYKSQFIANMSHELRTPLTSIIGFGKLLEEQVAGDLSTRQKKYSHMIVTSANQLLELINEILNLVKMEQCKEKVTPSTISICETINYVITLFEQEIEKNKLALTTTISSELPQPFWDFKKIIQLVSNLLSNAVKFTPENGSIEIEATQQGDNILIIVKDTGIGIKPENQKRVFLAFEQAESSYTRQYSGTGLGLSICKKIVEMHQGKIWLESNFGFGTSIFVLIPIQPTFQNDEGGEALVLL